MMAENIDELIASVEDAFWSVPIETTNFIFLSLMKALEGSLSVHGGNNYKLAHMSKYKLLRAGQLPTAISCSDDAVQCAYEVLSQIDL